MRFQPAEGLDLERVREIVAQGVALGRAQRLRDQARRLEAEAERMRGPERP